MNPIVEKIITKLKEMPRSKKILFGLISASIIAGFISVFFWSNQTNLKVAYSGLSKEDAALVVSKLKELDISYKLAGDGTSILVSDEIVYDVRLSMAKEGLPKGGGVGFEIFDKTDFGATEFVQKINKNRAIQGELSRTISAFDEVKSARVMIVEPEDSVFIEETKAPSASILLELISDLEQEEVAAIAHLVAGSIQDLTPKLITIVDTAGRILFEGKSEEELAKIEAKALVDTQYKYKIRFETNLGKRIQTMLERIVGNDKAIVRVTSEMDFSKEGINEEVYDPFERGQDFVRSRRNRAEKIIEAKDEDLEPSSVNPIVDPTLYDQGQELVNKIDDTYNYEISKRIRETEKPMAILTRLSVAAVIDGKYETKINEDGKKQKIYQPRTAEEMKQFEDIVVKAMGYNEDRNDQISMECFPFVSIGEIEPPPEITGWKMVQKEYGRSIANLLLVVLLFLFVIRPIIKTIKDVKKSVDEEEAALPSPEEEEAAKALLEEQEQAIPFSEMTAPQQKSYIYNMTDEEKDKFFQSMSAEERAQFINSMTIIEKTKYYAKRDPAKTANIIKQWLNEVSRRL